MTDWKIKGGPAGNISMHIYTAHKTEMEASNNACLMQFLQQ
jgi:hypothetical protein